MYNLPTSVEIGGVEYHIRNDGDYRMVLDLFSLLEDSELDKNERAMAALIVFYDGFEDISDLNQFSDIEEALSQMFTFLNAGKPEGEVSRHLKLLDWENDETMIVAGINSVAKTEIRALNYLHWWTFMSYYMSVGESTMSTVLGIRDKIARGKTLEKWEKQFRGEHPEYFVWESKTADEKADEQWILDLWKNNGEL